MKNYLKSLIRENKSVNSISKTKKITNEVLEEYLSSIGFDNDDVASMDRASKINSIIAYEKTGNLKINKNDEYKEGFLLFKDSTLLKYINQIYKERKTFTGATKSKTLSTRVDEYLLNKNFDITNLSLSDKLHVIKDEMEKRPACPVCGSITNFDPTNKTFLTYCSNRCAQNSDLTKLERRNTNIEKFGVENCFQSNELKLKIRKTNKERYGAEVISKSAIIQEKIANTNMERYGARCVLSNKEIIDSYVKKRRFEHYEYLHTLEHIKPAFKQDEYYGCSNVVDGVNKPIEYNWICSKCSNVFKEKYWFAGPGYIRCPKCEPKGSRLEIIISDFLDKYNIEYIPRSYSILDNKKQLDFYIPSAKLGIEVNGLYWHGEINQPDKNYHIDKLNQCNCQGISLLNIFEDDIHNKQTAIFSILKKRLHLNKYSISSDDCVVRDINDKLAKKFLDKYHMNGFEQDTLSFGVFYRNRLVSVMSIKVNQETAGILRFCDIANFEITGSYKSLIDHCINTYKPDKLFVMFDRNWDDTSLYINDMRFEHIEYIENYSYVEKNIRKNKIDIIKLINEQNDDIIVDDFDDSILSDIGIYKIYDAGFELMLVSLVSK